MRIRELIWLDNVVDKLQWKHGVRQYEVEEVLAGRRLSTFLSGATVREKMFTLRLDELKLDDTWQWSLSER